MPPHRRLCPGAHDATDGVAVLGINRTQDGSLCLLRDGEVVLCIAKERLSRRKHDWGRLGDLQRLYAPRLPDLGAPVDLVVESYSSDPEIAHLDDYRREIDQALRFRGPARAVRVSHHLAHLYSAFHTSGASRAAVMVIDFMGSPAADVAEPWPGKPADPGGLVEVASFYHASEERITCLGKQLWDRDRSRPVGLGCFYYFLTQALFPGEGNEGKTMGLAPYAASDELDLPPLEVDGWEVRIPEPWLALFAQRERFGHFALRRGSFADCARLAAAGQKAFEEALLALASRLHRATGLPDLCFVGGTALNCVANAVLLRRSPFDRVFIPPAPHDGGTALGAAVYGLHEVLGRKRAVRWTSDFLGPLPDLDDLGRRLADASDLVVTSPEDPVDALLQALLRGQVVGLFQGGSEFGPRALGHRSILALPEPEGVRNWINRRIKGREWFRPLAPMVLEEHAPDRFDLPVPSPFMLFAARARAGVRDRLPAVLHVDETARLQTVGEDGDPLVRRLLEAVARATGDGVLLNTSFNGPGEPIVETPEEAVACFRRNALDALVMPPYVIRNRGAPEAAVERYRATSETSSR